MRRFVLAALAAALAACGEPPAEEPAPAESAPDSASANAVSPADAQRVTALAARLDALEREVVRAEDASAIKRLQRTYGYYLDRGLWEDLADLFTEDAVGAYPAGVFVGRDSLRAHFLENNGRGYLGFEEGRLGNHIVMQPVITLAPDGASARGRWRVLAQLGQYGERASWAGGVYEIGYRKEDGVWKIAELEYFSAFSAPYETGWVGEAPGEASSESEPPAVFADLPHPPDEPSRADCPSYPGACIPPFHYANPASGRPFDAAAWRADPDVKVPDRPWSSALGGSTAEDPAPTDLAPPADPEAALAEAEARLASLRERATRLADERAIENLQRTYGYYLDRMLWDDMADLFAENGTIEIGRRGVYVGRERVRAFLHSLGPEGPRYGVLNDHLEIQPVIHVAPDGLTAKGRSRAIEMLGTLGEGGRIGDAVYENEYVEEDGVWKIAALHVFPIFMTDYDQGWAVSAIESAGPSETLPPDRPPTGEFREYPQYFVPPFHYPNPVTGEPVQYREEGE